MTESADEPSPVMIQIDRPGEQLSIESAKAILANSGVELDEKYGPYLVNPKIGRHVVRGLATAAVKRRLAEIPGVTVFSDLSVQTAKP